MEDRKCPECDTELNMNFYGRYNCKKCDATYYESDFVENEGGLYESNKKDN